MQTVLEIIGGTGIVIVGAIALLIITIGVVEFLLALANDDNFLDI